MPNPPLIVMHERIGRWHRRLCPIFLSLAPTPRWVESRSRRDLVEALAGGICPIVVLDVGDRAKEALEDLDQALATAPDALILVLDPRRHEGLAELARELGASWVISGPARPPDVIAMLERWLGLAAEREAKAGWAVPLPPEPEPWEDPEAFARKRLSAARWTGR